MPDADVPAGEEFSMTLPDGWREEQEDGSEFSASRGEEDMFVTVLSEPKSEFDFGFEEYAGKVVDVLVENVDGEIISGPTPVTANGWSGLQYEVSGTSEGVEIIYLDTVVDGERDFHQVASFTLASSYGENKPAMLELLGGFSIGSR
jgi:hypothetical protein